MELNYYFNTETFKVLWDNWKEYKKAEFKAKFKTQRGEQCQLTYLFNISKGSEQIAAAIIERSMGNHYQGLFELPINHILMQQVIQVPSHPTPSKARSMFDELQKAKQLNERLN